MASGARVLTRALLASIDTDAAVIEVVAGFLPVFGVPFLFVSWLMLLCMAFSMFGKAVKTAWLLVHAAVFLLLLLGAWLAVPLGANRVRVSRSPTSGSSKRRR